MRNELIDLYNLAISYPSNLDVVRSYQSARDRIGPQIVLNEILELDAARARIAELEAENKRLRDSLEEIFDYRGGADSALDDEYVVDRALAALAGEE